MIQKAKSVNQVVLGNKRQNEEFEVRITTLLGYIMYVIKHICILML